MTSSLVILPYHKHYAVAVSHIFHDCVHHSNNAEYSHEDKCAWSSAPRSSYYWNKRLSLSRAWIIVDLACELDGRPKCCGFINVETHFYTQGYIDSLYVHPDYQGKGVAYRLYEVLESWGVKQGYSALSVDASHGSKALFLSCGFKQRHRSYQEKLGRIISGFLMEKKL